MFRTAISKFLSLGVDAGNKFCWYIYWGGKVNYLKKGGMILGLMKTMIPYESESLTLEPGDALILFTDGITEAMNKNKEEFSDERLEKLAVNSADKSAKDILEMIRREVVKHVNGAEQSDDITLMVIKSL
ncbi:MAG TPA: PP2C family protein-serine/threonine phosphatase [Ignavibacteriales bacterium]|nr:PP2C family protein-serine/threonine phosphatase [Ignavibacteriales bacterium]